MMQFLKQLASSWANWLGDRDLELQLRKHLNEQGFYGDRARIFDLKLKAVQRPGWLQIFSFTVEAKSRLTEGSAPVLVYGVVRQDERYERYDIAVFEATHLRDRRLFEWSEGMIRR